MLHLCEDLPVELHDSGRPMAEYSMVHMWPLTAKSYRVGGQSHDVGPRPNAQGIALLQDLEPPLQDLYCCEILAR